MSPQKNLESSRDKHNLKKFSQRPVVSIETDSLLTLLCTLADEHTLRNNFRKPVPYAVHAAKNGNTT